MGNGAGTRVLRRGQTTVTAAVVAVTGVALPATMSMGTPRPHVGFSAAKETHFLLGYPRSWSHGVVSAHQVLRVIEHRVTTSGEGQRGAATVLLHADAIMQKGREVTTPNRATLWFPMPGSDIRRARHRTDLEGVMG